MVNRLSEYEPSNQIFPIGFHLHNRDHDSLKTDLDITLPKEFESRALNIAFSPQRVSDQFIEKVALAVEKATGVEPNVIRVPISKLGTFLQRNDYDFYVGPVGLADPEPEGVMSFYFEGDMPAVPSLSEHGFDYLAFLEEARREDNPDIRIKKMSRIVSKALNDGAILSLFHARSIGVGKADVDLSLVPLSDESITFKRIRMK